MTNGTNSNSTSSPNSSSTTKLWKKLTYRMKEKRQLHGAVPLPDKRILLTGGKNTSDCALDSVEIIDIYNTAQAQTKPSIQVPYLSSRRSSHASVLVKDYVYVIGGMDGSKSLRTVERFNINNIINTVVVNEDDWENVAQMRKSRSGYTSAAAVYSEDIFLFGLSGYLNEKASTSTAEYWNTSNTKTKKNDDGFWTLLNGTGTSTGASENDNKKDQMQVPRYHHVTVTVGDKIYIIGGENSQGRHINSVEVFDTSSRTFSSNKDDGCPPSLPIPLSHTSAVVVGRFIVLIGGQTTSTSSGTSTDDHATETKTQSQTKKELTKTIGASYFLDTTALDQGWKTTNCQLQAPRHGHTATLVDNDTICVCGGFDGGTNTTLDSIETIPVRDLIPCVSLTPPSTTATVIPTETEVTATSKTTVANRSTTTNTTVTKEPLLSDVSNSNIHSNSNYIDTTYENPPTLLDMLHEETVRQLEMAWDAQRELAVLYASIDCELTSDGVQMEE